MMKEQNLSMLSPVELYQFTKTVCEENRLEGKPLIASELQNRSIFFEKALIICHEEIEEALETQLGILMSMGANQVEIDHIHALRAEAKIPRTIPSDNLLPFLSKENRTIVNDVIQLSACLRLIQQHTKENVIEDNLLMIAKHCIDLIDLRPDTKPGNELIIAATNLILNIAINWKNDKRKLDKLSILVLEVNRQLKPLLDIVKRKLNPLIHAHQNLLFEIEDLFKNLAEHPRAMKRLRFEDERPEPLSQFFIDANPQRFKLSKNMGARIAKN